MSNRLDELGQKGESQLSYDGLIDEIGERYVAWVDLMGILDHLENEQIYPAVLRTELLAIISEYIDEDIVTIFTIGDGVIMVTEDDDYLHKFLDNLFLHYVRFNVISWRNEEDIFFNRLIRAGVGYGDIHKIDVERYCREHINGDIFHDNFSNKPFGPGIIKALRAEDGAPYSIHRYNDGGSLNPVYWWERIDLDKDSRIDIISMLIDYFDWYDGNYNYRYKPYKLGHFEEALDFFDIDESDI